jgi:hypothetical protein
MADVAGRTLRNRAPSMTFSPRFSLDRPHTPGPHEEMRMSQRTRGITVIVLIGICIACIVTFIVQHFMSSPRPSWHKELPWLALAFVSAAELARGSRRRRAMRKLD